MTTIIEKFHPKFQPLVEKLVKNCLAEGISIKVYFGLRSWAEQDAIYQRPTNGKDDDGDGKIDEADEKVTNARAGQSFHNYGLAVDVVPIVGGKAVWNDGELWERVGKVGEALGLEWGGRWKFVDKPHFQYPKGMKYTQLLALRNSGKVDSKGFVLI